MSIYKFFKCLAAGIILACFWVMIGIIFVGSLEIDQITRGVLFLFWFIFFIMFIAKELP
jgi:hypothetical protein